MAEAVILSVIESLDCWLLKNDGSFKKLYSLIVGVSDLGEEKKEKVRSLLLMFWMENDDEDEEDDEGGEEEEEDEGDDEDEEEEEDDEEWEEEEGVHDYDVEEVEEYEEEEDEDEWERSKKKLYNLLDLNKEKMYSLVVGMADFWEDYKETLYCLVFRVAKGDEKNELDKENLHSLVVEIIDLWEDDEGELNKEELHNLLFQMRNQDNYSKKNMRRLSGEVAGLWKDKHPKLNKERLYTWLANKVDLCEPNYLFRVLLDMVLLSDSSDFHEGVKEAKGEFGEILDLITDKKLGEENSLRYFISDVLDMAQRVRFLIQLQHSDPFALFFELSVLIQDFEYETYYGWLGKKFKRIMNELQEIKVSMLGFRVEKLQNVREMEGGKEVVGLEEDIKLLLCDENETTVITGMVGSGKTTLARQLYNHTTITQQFERRAWVCLSKVFSRKEMLVSLVRQMVGSSHLESLDKMECPDYKILKQVLRQQLLGVQYFIVLDDVSYDTTHLEYIKKALPKDKQGCRLLLTTRNKIVFWKYLKSTYYHSMKSMDDNKNWTLLLKTLSIEGSDEEFPKPLVKEARQILRKCGGLPLAIKEVGRNWAKKRQCGSEWKELIKSLDLTGTLGALESLYHDWDPQLQSRFLHLAFFKEGSPIRAKRLVHIWIIMGVVSKSKVVYQDNLRELFKEFVIDNDMDVKGKIKTWCVHPIFHMLSIRKAEEELNFEILREDGNTRHSRHRAIYCSREMLMNCSSNKDKNLVSLFFYGCSYINTSPSYWKHFEQLKTLDMEDFGLKILPDVIGMLSELRYLGLRNNYIQELPHSLSCLKKLEVLDIALNFMVELGVSIWELESLRHLYMSDISCQKPLRIHTLKNLETWTYVSAHNWEYEVSRLEMMTSLTKLGIHEVDGNTDVSKLFVSLAKLKNLEALVLRGFGFKSMPSFDEIGILQNLRELKLDGLITRLPSANYIRRLSLVNSCLHEDPMPILEKLPLLDDLKLQNAYTGQQMVISSNGFSHLFHLVIKELWHLTSVQIEEGAMKWLADLEISSCPNLEALPEDYCPKNLWMFKMKTTKKNATKIRESSFVSKIKKVDIQP